MITNVYVDAFNLYYGCLKGTSYRWLDLAKLCNIELPLHTINRIRYFTAIVSARPGDLTQPDRQAAFIRALETLPNVSVHYGHYLSSPTRMPLRYPPPGGPNTVEVIKTEEKGSDVNIATYLLMDAFDKDCEASIVISNDSDLEEPIRLVRQRFKIRVVSLVPCRGKRRPSVQLQKASSYTKIITETALAASQFPTTLTDANGTVTKPATW